MGKFVIKTIPTGIRFDLVAGNGEIIANSEVYTSMAACKNGIESVIRNAPIAVIEDQTAPGFAPEKHPKFEIYADKRGDLRFRLKATNGQIIASSEGYKSKAACKNGIDSVKRNAADGQIVQLS